MRKGACAAARRDAPKASVVSDEIYIALAGMAMGYERTPEYPARCLIDPNSSKKGNFYPHDGLGIGESQFFLRGAQNTLAIMSLRMWRATHARTTMYL